MRKDTSPRPPPETWRRFDLAPTPPNDTNGRGCDPSPLDSPPRGYVPGLRWARAESIPDIALCRANGNCVSCGAYRFEKHSFPLSLLWCLRRSSAKRLHSCWRLCHLTDMAYPLRVSGKRGDRSTGKFVYHHGFTNKLTTCGGMVIRIPMSGAAGRRPVVLSAPIRDTPVLSKTRCVLCQHLFF